MASDEPFHEYLIDLTKAVPCSECVPPDEYRKRLIDEETF
jgi:hypothetical protein